MPNVAAVFSRITHLSAFTSLIHVSPLFFRRFFASLLIGLDGDHTRFPQFNCLLRLSALVFYTHFFFIAV